MEEKIFKCAERCTAIFFYISAIQMMISTGVSNYFFYNIQILVNNKIEASGAKYSQLNEYSY